jgi:hypothetical protein|eukprot:COSAG01_NODE_2543_length_7429_cov_6.011122_6_plen_58_part_00
MCEEFCVVCTPMISQTGLLADCLVQHVVYLCWSPFGNLFIIRSYVTNSGWPSPLAAA